MKYDYMMQILKELPNSMDEAITDAMLMIEENEELQALSDKLSDAELKLLKFLQNQPEGLELFKEYKKCFENHAKESCGEMYIQGLFDHHRVYAKHQLISAEALTILHKRGEF